MSNEEPLTAFPVNLAVWSVKSSLISNFSDWLPDMTRRQSPLSQARCRPLPSGVRDTLVPSLSDTEALMVTVPAGDSCSGASLVQQQRESSAGIIK